MTVLISSREGKGEKKEASSSSSTWETAGVISGKGISELASATKLRGKKLPKSPAGPGDISSPPARAERKKKGKDFLPNWCKGEEKRTQRWGKKVVTSRKRKGPSALCIAAGKADKEERVLSQSKHEKENSNLVPIMSLGKRVTTAPRSRKRGKIHRLYPFEQ